MNVPRDRMNPNERSDGTDHHYRPMSINVYSNGPMSEADIFRNAVNKVVARNGLSVDWELLNRYIDQRIQSGDMLTRGSEELSGNLEPWTLKNNKKGFKVSVDAEFQEVIASFAKAPLKTLEEYEQKKDSTEKTSTQGTAVGNSTTSAKATPGDSSTPSPQSTPGATDNTSTGAPSNQSEPSYGIPPGRTLSDVAGGCDPQPIDVTLSKLSTAVYGRYGPPPEGWRAINQEDIAKRLGVDDPNDPKVTEWFRQYLGGDYAQEGDTTKRQMFKAEIYTDDKGNFVLAYRGTAEGLGDWYHNNGKQGLGYPTDGENDKFSGTAVSTAQEFAKMFGKFDASGKPINVAIVGHSQGGALATVGAVATGIPAVTFDSAGVHPNTFGRMNTDAEKARKFAEGGGIRAYSLQGDALTDIQGGKSVVGIIAPDVMGTKIRVKPPKDKEGRMMEEYGEPEIGMSKTTRKIIDTKIPSMIGEEIIKNGIRLIPVVGPIIPPAIKPVIGKDLSDLPDAAIRHSPLALTDAITEQWKKAPEKRVEPVPVPRPTPTPTPTPPPVVDNGPPKVAPVPQPHPTPTPKKNPDQNDQLQSVVRSPQDFESAPATAAVIAGRSMSKNMDEQALLDDPTHPRNAMFKQAIGPINARDAELGRGSDDTSARLAAGMTADARARGLETIAFAQFSPDGQKFYMADTANPSAPWARTAVGDVGPALQQSVVDSSQRVAQIDLAQAQAKQQAQPTQQQNIEQSGPVIQGPRLV
jgi:hypothetical protein